MIGRPCISETTHRKGQRMRLAILLIALTLNGLASAEPTKGGTLIFGRGSDSVGLDPAAREDGESLNVTDNIFDNLVQFKLGTTELEPSLATKWDVSADGLTYTFHLRPNVKFHDGTPLDADAVVFSFRRQMDPKHEAYKFSGPYLYWANMGLDTLVKDVSKVDAMSVKFTLVARNATFLPTLAMQAFAVVSPTAVMKYKEDFFKHPVGSGPFKFKTWEKNQKIVLEANKEYWGTAPHVSLLIWRAIPDNNTRLQEMLAGNLHVMDNPDSNHIATLQQRLGDKVKLAKQPGLNLGYLAMNMEKPPFDKVEVRQAIAHAINRQAIVDSVYNGYASVAKNPMPPTLWGYNEDVKTYEYSPEKAKELLKKAGLESGFETDLWAMPVPRPYMPDGRKVAEAIQGDLAKVGIKVKIVSYDWGTYLKNTKNGEHMMALLGWTADIGDPDNFLYVLLDKDNTVKPSAQNISFYKNDKVHELLTGAQVETDQAKRAAKYKEAQKIIADEVPMLPLVHSIEVIPMKKEVENYIMDPTGRRRFGEVWIDKTASH